MEQGIGNSRFERRSNYDMEQESIKMKPREYIKIRGANEHNLKGIDVDIPRNEQKESFQPSRVPMQWHMQGNWHRQ